MRRLKNGERVGGEGGEITGKTQDQDQDPRMGGGGGKKKKKKKRRRKY